MSGQKTRAKAGQGERAAYMRRYYKEHREEHAAYQRRYRKEHRKEINAYMRKWRGFKPWRKGGRGRPPIASKSSPGHSAGAS